MASLLSAVITTAAAGVAGPVLQLREGPPDVLQAQASFVYGSGGTSVTCWIQTSLDGGISWSDVIAFAAFTTASARFIANVNLLANRVPVAATDGTLAASTVNSFLGTKLRVKYTSVGTYAGNTTLNVDVAAGGRRWMQATG